jgi:hypothetical protein
MSGARTVTTGIALARRVAMTEIQLDVLRSVRGGMNTKNLPLSTNIEDRRQMTPWQSTHVATTPAPPIQRPPRRPGDLPSQAGIDDIGKH